MAYIEWKNINNPDFSNVSNMIQAGGNNLNTAINTLTNVANKINQGQIDAQKANLIKQAMANSSDPEQLSRFFAEATNNPAFDKLRPGDWMQAQQFQNDLLNTNKLQGEVADATWARNTKKDTADFATAIKAAIASGDPNRIAQANQALLNASQGKNYDPSQLFFGNILDTKQKASNVSLTSAQAAKTQRELQQMENYDNYYRLIQETIKGLDPSAVPFSVYDLRNAIIEDPNAHIPTFDRVLKDLNLTPQSTAISDTTALEKDLNESGAKIVNANVDRTMSAFQSQKFPVKGITIPTTNYGTIDTSKLPKNTTELMNYLENNVDKQKLSITLEDGREVPLTKDNYKDYDYEILPGGAFTAKYSNDTLKAKKEQLLKEYSPNIQDWSSQTIKTALNQVGAAATSARSSMNPSGLSSTEIKLLNDRLLSLDSPTQQIAETAKFLQGLGYEDATIDHIAESVPVVRSLMSPELRDRVSDAAILTAIVSTFDPSTSGWWGWLPWTRGNAPGINEGKAADKATQLVNNPNLLGYNITREQTAGEIIQDAKATKESWDATEKQLKDVNAKIAITKDKTSLAYLTIYKQQLENQLISLRAYYALLEAKLGDL